MNDECASHMAVGISWNNLLSLMNIRRCKMKFLKFFASTKFVRFKDCKFIENLNKFQLTGYWFYYNKKLYKPFNLHYIYHDLMREN